jgi:acetyl esterase/lipase
MQPVFYARVAVVLSLLTFSTLGFAQDAVEQVPLWPDGAPGFEDRRDEPEQRPTSYAIGNIHNPSLTVYLPIPEDATGAAVVICPGGGHRELVFDAEGTEAAKFLNRLGVAAFVLKYRLAREPDSPYTIEEHARADGLRAVRLVRRRASEWNVDPRRVGMLGFSAGGEVVSLVAHGAGEGDDDAEDPVERQSGRPDFQVLVYPGPLGIPEAVSENAPPAFLVVANDDRGSARNVVDLLDKYRAARVPVEVHIFARGGHAFNMGRLSELISLHKWPMRMADWMRDNYVLTPQPRQRGQRQRGQRQPGQRERGGEDATARRERRPRRERRQGAESNATEPTATVDPSGAWTWETTFGDSDMEHKLVLQTADGQLSGTYAARFDSATAPPAEPIAIENAKIVNNVVSFSVNRSWNDREFTIHFEGAIEGDAIEGFSEIDLGENTREFEWLANRADASREEDARREETDDGETSRVTDPQVTDPQATEE